LEGLVPFNFLPRTQRRPAKMPARNLQKAVAQQ